MFAFGTIVDKNKNTEEIKFNKCRTPLVRNSITKLKKINKVAQYKLNIFETSDIDLISPSLSESESAYHISGANSTSDCSSTEESLSSAGSRESW